MSGYIGANTSVTQIDGFTRAEANTNVFDLPFAEYGGTANAITLTTGANLTELIVGMKIRFIPTATNTGATTIKVDSTNPVGATTPFYSVLPSGYLLSGFLTEAVYDGVEWVVYRQVERNSNTNGEYIKFEDGTVYCFRNAYVLGDGTATISGTWTYPVVLVKNSVSGETDGRRENKTSVNLNISGVGHVSEGNTVTGTNTIESCYIMENSGYNSTLTISNWSITMSSVMSGIRDVVVSMSALGRWY